VRKQTNGKQILPDITGTLSDELSTPDARLQEPGLLFQTRPPAGPRGAFQRESHGRVADPFVTAEGSASDDAFPDGGQLGVGLWFVDQRPPISR
tara:strand:- start:425 stop:706 length:282 start_codon:yes stop_codon:yes gene_type:complete